MYWRFYFLHRIKNSKKTKNTDQEFVLIFWSSVYFFNYRNRKYQAIFRYSVCNYKKFFSIRGYLFWQFVFSCDILSQASSYSKETLVFHNGDIFTWAECSEQQHEVGRRWLLLSQWLEIIFGETYCLYSHKQATIHV